MFFHVFCEYSHIPMAVNQELLLDTTRVQRQGSEITLILFGRPPQDMDKTTLQQPQKKGWRLAMMPPWASRHIGGARQHPRHTTARKGRPWEAHPLCDKHAQPKRQTRLSLTTCMFHVSCVSFFFSFFFLFFFPPFPFFFVLFLCFIPFSFFDLFLPVFPF